MLNSILDKGFSLINSSQGIFVKEDSMSGSTSGKGSLNFSQDSYKEEDFISLSSSAPDEHFSCLSYSLLSLSFICFSFSIFLFNFSCLSSISLSF